MLSVDQAQKKIHAKFIANGANVHCLVFEANRGKVVTQGWTSGLGTKTSGLGLQEQSRD